VPIQNQPDDLGTKFADLERRLRGLETAPRGGPLGTLGLKAAVIDTQESTSSATYVDLATAGPTCTVTVGISQSVLVTATVFITAAANQSPSVELFMDGSDTGIQILALYATSAPMSANVASARIVTGVSAGPHTFSLRYKRLSGTGAVFFAARSLVVQPL
jgi:hypothetical protein